MNKKLFFTLSSMGKGLSIFLLSLVVLASGCVDSSQEQKPANAEIEEVVLRLSDLNGKYNFAAELNETKSSVSGTRKREFEQKAVVRQYKRLFTREEGEKGVPYQIISTAVIYENKTSAKLDLNSSLETIRKKDGKITEVSIMGKTVYKTSWKSLGSYHTTFYYQTGRRLYWVFSTEKQDRDYDKRMKELMTKMIEETEN